MASTHDGRPWWQRWPSELTSIVADLRAQGWAVAKVTKDKSRHEVRIELGGLPDPPGSLIMLFGPGTPSSGPTVFGPEGPREHRHPTERNLCLPHDATDTVTAVNAAIKLYQEPAATAARAAEPWSGYIRHSHEEALVLPIVLPAGEWGTFVARAIATATTMWGWVETITVGAYSKPSEVASADQKFRQAMAETAPGVPMLQGVWFRTTKIRYPLDAADLLQFWRANAPAPALQVSETIPRRPGQYPGIVGPQTRPVVRLNGLVVPEEGPEKGVWSDRLIVLVERQDGPTTVVVEPLTLSAVRLPGLEALPEGTVAVAGIGMIGATVATHLARSGIGGLRLLDHDRVEVGNLVRQPYDIRDVGMLKTRALRRRLLREAPWCSVDPQYLLSMRAQWHRPEQLLSWLDGCDLLVAATADLQAEIFLSRFAKEAGVPVVGGWVGAGIWGGFVYRTRWGESACRSCIDHHYAELVRLPEPDGARNLFVAGCGHPTFPGSIVDGTTVSDVMARLALNVLTPGYPDAPGDVATVTLRGENEAGSVALAWETVQPSPDCELCR